MTANRNRRLTLIGLRVDDVRPITQRKDRTTIMPPAPAPAPERDTWPSISAPYTDLPDGARLEGNATDQIGDLAGESFDEQPRPWTVASALLVAIVGVLIAVVAGAWAWLLGAAVERWL